MFEVCLIIAGYNNSYIIDGALMDMPAFSSILSFFKVREMFNDIDNYRCTDSR
jgi:hypothetical protein